MEVVVLLGELLDLVLEGLHLDFRGLELLLDRLILLFELLEALRGFQEGVQEAVREGGGLDCERLAEVERV